MPPTNLHRLITSHSEWLNTSRPLKAEDLEGRIILLDFWTYCCINCMHVIPDLKYLEERFGDKLTVIGVHSAKFQNERDSDNIRQAILRYGIRHPVTNDADFTIWQGFGVRAWPTFVLINPKGIVEDTWSGEGNRDRIAAEIETLVRKYDGKITTAPLPIALEENKQPPGILSFPGKIAHYPGFSDPDTHLMVSDSGHHRILLLQAPRNGGTARIVDQIGSGTEGFKDGSFETAQFRRPQGLLLGRDDNTLIYIADTENHALRVANMRTRMVTTLAGTGKQGFDRQVENSPAPSTPLSSPWDLAFYPDDKHIAIAMAGTHQIWSYDIGNKTVSVIAGNGRESIDDGKYPHNSLAQPSGLSAVDGKLYFVDAETSSLRVLENNEVKTLIGTGLFDFGYKEGKQGVARMQHPLGLFADDKEVYIADAYNHSLRRYDLKTGLLSNFAGHGVRGKRDGALAQAEFNEPNDIQHIDGEDWVADTDNNAIRVIDLNSKTVTTLAIKASPAVEKAEAGSGETFTFSDRLPNLEPMAPVALAAGEPADIILALQPGWHINDEAPSYLALFTADKMPVVGFDREAVKGKNLALPALKPGNYRLQSTLYYCEDKEGSQCLLKSFDMPVVSAKGQKEITLKVN